MKEWHLTSASVAYFKKDDYSDPIIRGYGTTSANGHEKVTGDTAFMIASMSKTILGSLVAKLFDVGIMSPDDDIKNVIPQGWASGSFRNPEYPTAPVTWRSILTHRSSMRENVHDMKRSYGPEGAIFGSKKGNPTCPLTDLSGFYQKYMTGAGATSVGGRDYDWHGSSNAAGGAWTVTGGPGNPRLKKTPNFSPAGDFDYSNFATGYLALLAEFALKKAADSGGSDMRPADFPKLSLDHIFGPLGMKNTAWFREDLPRGTKQVSPSIYDPTDGKTYDVGHYCFIDYASGQLHTSAADLMAYGRAWLDYGKAFGLSGAGEDAVKCQMRDAAGNMPADDGCTFGYLWKRLTNGKRDNLATNQDLDALRTFDWTDGITHGGSEVGIKTKIVVLPKSGVVAVVMLSGLGHRIEGKHAIGDFVNTFLDNVPEKYDGRTATWSSPPPPMPPAMQQCSCQAFEVKAHDVDGVEKAGKEGHLGVYTPTGQWTGDEGDRRLVYGKGGVSDGYTLSYDAKYGDWRTYKNAAPADPIDPAEANNGAFYSWAGNKAACPSGANDWRVQTGGQSYTKDFGATVVCAT